MWGSRRRGLTTLTSRPILLFLAVLTLISPAAAGETASVSPGDTSFNARRDEVATRLQRAYPGFVAGISDNEVLLTDGSTLPYDDGTKDKSAKDWITDPDIEDMFRYNYPAGAPALVPEFNFDPGRARNADFFTKMYGDCRKDEVSKHLAKIVWLPKKYGRKLLVTSINGVDKHLQAVSDELDALPKTYDIDLFPIAGIYNCRSVMGTRFLSPHGYGIAIDISLRRTDYWRWRMFKITSPIKYRNKLPIEIIRIFEKHGFIWGGRWFHYDTMHFEYRPELLPAVPPGAAATP